MPDAAPADIPLVVHHAFAAARRLAQLYGQLGQCSQGMSAPSDWSGVSRWQLTGHAAVTTSSAVGVAPVDPQQAGG